jgi:uncharacterized membrane protein (DUF373 family)
LTTSSIFDFATFHALWLLCRLDHPVLHSHKRWNVRPSNQESADEVRLRGANGSGIVDFLDGANGSVSAAAPELLDRVLLVLILIEIVHTVVLSLRAHRLVAQPFIVVGLIAVIRRILVVLTPGGPPVGAAELGLLIGMVAVFVAGLIAVSLVEKGADADPSGPAI